MQITKRAIGLTFSLVLTIFAAHAQEQTFEGELTYESTVTSSKGMQKLFPSLFKNGTYEMQFVFKGQKTMVLDTYVGLVQIEDRERDMAYMYSPLLKKGYKYVLSHMEKQMDEKYAAKYQGQMTRTGEEKEIEGLRCVHYKAHMTKTDDILGSQITTTATIDCWVCPDFRPTFLGSIHIPGQPIQFDELQSVELTLMGSQRQHQNLMMTEVKRRSVDDVEMNIPSDILLQFTDDAESSLMKLQKEIHKYMKKNKIADSGVKVNHGQTESLIEGDDWD